MSTITEKLKWLVEADATSAVKGFEQAGTAAEKNLKKAETSSQKLGGQLTKVGAGAVAMGGIIGSAVIKAAGAFEDLALKAGQMSDATGLSVDEASRWIEVSGDMGIGADTIESALGKMNKTLGSSPEKFAALGIEIAATKTGVEDVNGTFINTIARLNEIEDPAARAAAAASIFGKGWQGAAELLKLSTDDIKTQLASVSDQKVINEEELQKAKDYRADLDHLKDSAEDFALAIGQSAAPVIGAIASVVGTAVEKFTSLDKTTHGAAGGILAAGAAALGIVGSLAFLAGQAIKVRDRFTTLAEDGTRSMTAFGKGAEAAAGVAALAVIGFTINAAEAAKSAAGLAKAIEAVSRATDANLLEAFNHAIVNGYLAGKDLKETMDALAQSNIEGAARVRDMIQAHVAAGTATADEKKELAPLVQAIKDEEAARRTAKKTTAEYKDTTDEAAESMINSQNTAAGYSYALQDVERSTEATRKATEEATRKSDAFAKSLQGQIDKLAELYPKEYDAVKAKYDYAAQTEDTMIKVDALNTTLGDHKAKQEDIKAATDAARDAIITQSEKFAELDGAASGSEGAIRRQIESLKAQEASLAPDSPLRTFLDQYIADLEAIPSNISTIMDLHISQGQVTTAAGDVIGQRFGKHAAGGRIPYGETLSLVGEDGPELISAEGASVYTAGQTAAMLRPDSGGPGSSATSMAETWKNLLGLLASQPTTNITINGANMTPEELVRQIKVYERRNGTAWRS